MLFSEAIYGFYLYLASGNYSPITARNYRLFLETLDKHLGHPELEKVTQVEIREFFLHLREEQRNDTTLQAYWRTLRTFYRWACAELRLADNPALLIAMPKGKSRAVEPFTDDELRKLAEACKRRRDRALLLLLLDTGLRVSEMCRLTVGDLDMDTGAITVRAWSTGKKSKPRVVRLGNNGRRAMWAYLASRGSNADRAAPLIATLRDERSLDRYAIGNLLERIANRAGVKKVYPHRFRHTFAIYYLRNGGDAFSLQELLGHENLNTVRIYIRLAQADLATVHKRASPVDNLRL